MIKDPLIQWAESELKRLDTKERREKSRMAYEERELIKRERYINAPVINLEGKIVDRKPLSKGKKD